MMKKKTASTAVAPGGPAERHLGITYQDEYPPPPSVSTHTLHKPNSIRQDSTKRTGQTSSREKQGHPVVTLRPSIPHRQVENYTREQSTFCNTEEEACGQESAVVLGYT
jgi:hypothetical protein